jgi:hypothetical protein
MRWHEAEWLEANQRSLMAQVDRLYRLVESQLATSEADSPRDQAAESAAEPPPWVHPEPPAWETLQMLFGLSEFERDILLLCAGVELSSRLRERCERLAGERQPAVSFGMALALLGNPHWSALAPDQPLRRWKLIDLDHDRSLTGAGLRIDEPILHVLTGHLARDERLRDLVVPLGLDTPLFASHAANVAAIGRSLQGSGRVSVHGVDPLARQQVAARSLAELGLHAFRLRAADVPLGAQDRAMLATLWSREAAIVPAGLVIEVGDHETNERKDAVGAFLGQVKGAVIVSHRDPLSWAEQPLAQLELARPSAEEQRTMWRQLLAHTTIEDRELDGILSEFRVGVDQMLAAASTLEALAESGENQRGHGAVWQLLRRSSRGRLDALAQRIESDAGWDDLVVPAPTLELLRALALQARHRATVYETWGFASRSRRGLGLSALFSGPSGVGKTMAAEVIANELELDLYKIDLSQMVSKYIGETEKNLARVFDVAEAGGVVLLFDEADALFGQRSEVKDSHDRYANIEVSYLLQRMEAFRGIAILTTNQKSALDSAFLRRIRFMVPFPHPDLGHRAILWRKAFPATSPASGLDIDRLARLNLTGGNIRSVAINAAFLAAEASEPVGMHHVIRAARAEYQKLERPFSAAELGGAP